ncbi:MAG: hypothetical protein RLZZ200_2703 [Pseudomonadota bacterium]|jgi:hypothetical protein
MMTVTLLKRFTQRGGPAYNVGERVSLPDPLATDLIVQGIARAVEAPAVHRMIETAPIKKDNFLKRKGR